MKWLLWIVAGLLVYWLVMKKKAAAMAAAGYTTTDSTNSQGAKDPWAEIIKDEGAITNATYNQNNDFLSGAQGLFKAVGGLFGGYSTATGTQSPSTSGSGTASPSAPQPDNSVGINDNWDTWSSYGQEPQPSGG